MRWGLSLNGEQGEEDTRGKISYLKQTFLMPIEIIHEVANPYVQLVINKLEEDSWGDHVINHANHFESLSNWRYEVLVDVIAIK